MNLSNADFGGIIKLHEIAYGSKGKTVFKIPYYQRPYEWDAVHIENLVSDYVKNKNYGTSEEYFVGATVLVATDKGLEVVDGQQRITTMYLLNYLSFAFQRALVDYDLQSAAYINQASKDLDKLQKKYSELIGINHLDKIEKMISAVNSKIAESTKFFIEGRKEDGQVASLKAKNEYRNCMKMSNKSTTDKEYFEDSAKLLNEFLEMDDLSLQYSRAIFNNKLKKALSYIVCALDSNGEPDLKINRKKVDEIKENDEIVGQYVSSVYCAYKAIISQARKTGKSERELTLLFISLIEEMVEKIEFCAVITGSEKDAYALFESLNDRNKAVDDLDLIKNLYLRTYYNKSGNAPEELESGLEKIDHIWSDYIFTKENRSLISLLGAVYITGDTNIDEKNALGVRKTIDAYLEKIEQYSLVNVCDDVKIYKLIRELLNATTKKEYNHTKALLIAENDIGMSITYKCIHLLRALKYTNVLSGIVNVIIKIYLNQNIGNIDITDFKNNFLPGLALADKENDAKFAQISSIAYDIWRLSIMSDNYELPRKYAVKLIEGFNKNVYNPTVAILSNTMYNEAKKKFGDWLMAWRYGSTNKDIKVKVLLLRLLQSDNDMTKREIRLLSATAIVLKKPQKAELDHLEPLEPDMTFSNDAYFQPSKGKVRNEIINGLGNFMLLDNCNNKRKRNWPLSNAMKHYDKMLAGKKHWLIEEIKKDISDGHNFETRAGFDVPKESFFIERRSRLITYFNAIMSAEKYDTDIVKY